MPEFVSPPLCSGAGAPPHPERPTNPPALRLSVAWSRVRSVENLMTELNAALTAEPDSRKPKLDALWAEIDPADHASRCIAAHFIADLQEDLDDEVAWDEVSLRESVNVSDADLQAIHPTLTVAGFMPSLHLNLADGYRRQGRFAEAADRLGTSREFDFALTDGTADEKLYADGIREAQERVRRLIAAEDRTKLAPPTPTDDRG